MALSYKTRLITLHFMRQYKSMPMFENPLLEKFSHVHPIVPLVLWLPVVGYCLWKAASNPTITVVEILSFFIAGVVTWTLAEYCLHRFLFHWNADSKIGKRIVFIFHGIHHDDPNDWTRLVMPPVPAIFLAVIFFSLFQVIFGVPKVFPFFSGFILGYLAYDYIHYATHHFKPRTAFGRYLKQNHMLHHFSHKGEKWGVSSPLWDFVFGTYLPKK